MAGLLVYAAWVLVCAALASLAYLTFFDRVAPDVSARGRDLTDMKLSGRRIGQTFVSAADGLTAIVIHLRGAERRAVRLACELSRLEGEVFRPIYRWSEVVTIADAATARRLTFPPVRDAAGYTFQLHIFLQGLDRPDTYIRASTDEAPGAGSLTVDGRPTSGDLVFDTVALGTTRYGRFCLHASQLPSSLWPVGVQLPLAAAFVWTWLVLAFGWLAPSRAGWREAASLALVIALLTGVVLLAAPPEPPRVVTLDLLDRIDSAQIRSTLGLAEALQVGQFTIAGETKRGLLARPASRVVWRLKLPSNPTLQAYVALEERAWNAAGDGVTFRVIVSDLQSQVVALDEHVNPAVWAFDRRWIPVTVDLRAYGGRQVELTLSTHAGRGDEATDARNDQAVWGEPTLMNQ